MQFHLTVGHANKVNHLQTKLVKDGTSRLLVDGVDDAKASDATLKHTPPPPPGARPDPNTDTSESQVRTNERMMMRIV